MACAGVGDNYPDACRQTAHQGDADTTRFVEGLESVLSGRTTQFEHELFWDGPGEPRWFLGRITSCGTGTTGRTIVAHEDITSRKLADEERRQSEQDWQERTQAEEQKRVQIERLSVLRSIDAVITASLDLRLTLQFILEQVSHLLNVDAVDILLLNEKTLMLECASSRGFRHFSLQHSTQRLVDGQAGLAALARRLVQVHDVPRTIRDFAHAELLVQEGIVSYLGVPLLSKGHILGVLEVFHRGPLNPTPDWLEFLQTLAGQGAIAIQNAVLFENLQRSNLELSMAYDATIEGWSRAMDLRDHETEGHCQRVTAITLELARAIGVCEEEQVYLRHGSLLHDIGKMGIPDSILLKPGPLTEEEWEIMRRHPQFAYEMLSPIAFLQDALDIPHYHHEKWDGSGYPQGLEGEQIPLAARIFAVADVWDALRSDRPYRSAWSVERTREHLHRSAGSHFDPAIVEVFLNSILAFDEQILSPSSLSCACDRKGAPSRSEDPLEGEVHGSTTSV